MTTAMYPGSFDPVHNGHLAIIETASRLFEHLLVAVGYNPAKPSGLFAGPERVSLLQAAIAAQDQINPSKIEVITFDGLVTAAAADRQVDCLIKGVRSGTDLDQEMLQANMNSASAVGLRLPTVFIPGLGVDNLISSRYIREIALAGGDVRSVVPTVVADGLRRKSETQ